MQLYYDMPVDKRCQKVVYHFMFMTCSIALLKRRTKAIQCVVMLKYTNNSNDIPLSPEAISMNQQPRNAFFIRKSFSFFFLCVSFSRNEMIHLTATVSRRIDRNSF